MKKPTNGKDAVAQTREALVAAEGQLTEHDAKKLTLDTEAAKLTAALDQAMLAGDEAGAQRAVKRLDEIERMIASLGRTRPGLAQAVEGAQAAVKQAEAARAQAEIDAQNETLDRLNGQITEALAGLLAKIAQHEELVGVRDRLAKSFDLPTPGRMRFLFPHDMVTSGGADVLRARLDVRHVLGGIQQQPADSGPPLFAVPA